LGEKSYFQKINRRERRARGENNKQIDEALAKLLKAVENRHSGQAKRDPESRIFKRFWIPASAGMTE
jgi:hypothetical protein